MAKGEYDDKLDKLFKGREHEELLLTAKRLARECGIFRRERGYGGMETIKEALRVANAVWEVEAYRRKHQS